jgi:hypothetical protein
MYYTLPDGPFGDLAMPPGKKPSADGLRIPMLAKSHGTSIYAYLANRFVFMFTAHTPVVASYSCIFHCIRIPRLAT